MVHDLSSHVDLSEKYFKNKNARFESQNIYIS